MRLRLTGTRQPATLGCGTCRHFVDDPRLLEEAIPGWATLGSAFGAVRGDDGLCQLLDRHVSAGAYCSSHRVREG